MNAHVYVLEVGCYDKAFIRGVYANPEAAMVAHSPQRPARTVRGSAYGNRAGESWTYEWSGPDENGSYQFEADWEDAAEITRYEVQGG